MAMTSAMLVLMAHGAMSDLAHEILGMATFGLFIAHHILNVGWLRTHFRRPRLDAILAINALLFVVLIGTAVSSMLVSESVFAFAHIEGGLFARRLHACTTAWCFVLTAIHLGLHMDLSGFGVVFEGTGERPTLGRSLRCAAASVVAGYGVYACFIHRLPERLAMHFAYSFWPAEKNWLLFVHMAAVMCTFSCSASLASRMSREFGKGKERTRGVRSVKDQI
jgi:hypothetical protein